MRDDDGNQSLQPIMLDSLISNVPTLKPAPPINGVKKKVRTKMGTVGKLFTLQHNFYFSALT